MTFLPTQTLFLEGSPSPATDKGCWPGQRRLLSPAVQRWDSNSAQWALSCVPSSVYFPVGPEWCCPHQTEDSGQGTHRDSCPGDWGEAEKQGSCSFPGRAQGAVHTSSQEEGVHQRIFVQGLVIQGVQQKGRGQELGLGWREMADSLSFYSPPGHSSI